MMSGSKDLRRAAALVRQAILAKYESEAEDVTFSPEFERKIVSIDAAAHRRERFVKTRRSIAAVLLAILLCGSVFLASDPDAFAVFREWVLELYEDHIVFRFPTNSAYTDSTELPYYAPTWLPEGMELVDIPTLDTKHLELYMDESGKVVIIEYFFADDSTMLLYSNLDGSEVQLEEITVHGNKGYYILPDEDGESNIMWIENGISFTIDGTLEKPDMLHIAESLVLVKTEK